jgi:inner membrane protein
MDSLTHVVLGAAVGMAVMGRRTALWKAAAWGAVANTLPDLDVFIDHGDAIANMVLHRAETHSLFWLTLFSLPFGALVARLNGQWPLWRRWWLAMGLALISHPLLDAMTVYGTQLALPWSDRPYGVGSIFIVDPLVTLPLLVGTGVALRSKRLRANTAGLVLSTAYLAWGVVAQQQVERVARDALAAQGLAAEHVLVTPTAFNSVAWRVVVMQREHYLEGFYSLLDKERTIAFDRFDRGTSIEPELRGILGYQHIGAFSRGFYALREHGARVLISDLRMGQEPAYTFTFAIAERASPAKALAVPEQIGTRPDLDQLLPWLWQRVRGNPLPPPR